MQVFCDIIVILRAVLNLQFRHICSNLHPLSIKAYSLNLLVGLFCGAPSKLSIELISTQTYSEVCYAWWRLVPDTQKFHLACSAPPHTGSSKLVIFSCQLVATWVQRSGKRAGRHWHGQCMENSMGCSVWNSQTKDWSFCQEGRTFPYLENWSRRSSSSI